MENINIRFNGSANFKEVYGQIERVNAELLTMQKRLAQTVSESDLRSTVNTFNQRIKATGQFVTQAYSAQTATQKWTESLVKNDLSFNKLVKSRRIFNDILKEQLTLQNMVSAQWTKSAMGRVSANMIVPTGVTAEVNKLSESLGYNTKQLLTNARGMVTYRKNAIMAQTYSQSFNQALDVMRLRVGLASQMLQSGSENLIKWGKNTQWAGRQLMVGLTVPLIAFGAVAGIQANAIESQLTRIIKVYDFTAQELRNKDGAISKLRTDSLKTAKKAAEDYGSAAKDTLAIEAELAATGLRGANLFKATAETQRVATLGELDYNQAIKTTIALQNAFKLTSKEMTDAFNFANEASNLTSLSLSDFVEAAPRAASALSALGVNVKQMTILLAAMKANGVDAAQGANALKSAATKVLNPTKAAASALAAYNIDINEIVTNAKGNLFVVLEELGKQMKGLDNLTKRKIIAKLFGTYQFNRLNAALDGIASKTGQVGRVIRATEESSSELAAKSAAQLKQITESPSGKFRKYLHELQLELATTGETFLSLANIVLNAFIHVNKFFNSWPGWLKKAALFGAIFVGAIIPAMTMFTGLVVNLVGQMGRLANIFVLWVGKAIGATKGMTVAQRAEMLVAKQTSAEWYDQAAAARALSLEIANLNRNMAMASKVGLKGLGTEGAAVAPAFFDPRMGATNKEGKKPGAWKNSATNAVIKESQAEALLAGKVEKSTSAAAVESGKFRGNMVKAAGAAAGLAVIGGIMVEATGHSSEFLSNMINIAFAATLVGPSLLKGIKAAAASGAFTEVKNALGVLVGTKGVMGKAGFAKALGGFGMSIARFAGPAALLTTAVITILKIKKGISDAAKEQDKLNNSAQNWATILGFAYKKQPKLDFGSQLSSADKAQDKIESAADKIAKVQPQIIADIKSAKTEQDKLNIAIQEGWKVLLSGGNAKQATRAVQASLMAAFRDPTIVQGLMVKVHAQVDFSDTKDLIAQQGEQIGKEFQREFSNGFKEGRWASIGDAIFGGELNTRAKHAALATADEFIRAFKAVNPTQRAQLFDSATTAMNQQGDKFFQSIQKKYSDVFSKIGVTNLDQLNAAISKGQIKGFQVPELNKYNEAQQAIVSEMIKKLNLDKEETKNLKTMADLMAYLQKKNLVPITAQQALIEYNKRIQGLIDKFGVLAPSYQLFILNQERAKAGLGPATSLTQGFSSAVDGLTDSLNENTTAAAANQNAITGTTQQLIDATKTVFTSAQGDAVNRADEIWSEWADSQENALDNSTNHLQDALEKRYNKMLDDQTKSFKKREAALASGYDVKIKAITKEINAEKTAEKIRQKMYEAEKTRLARLAELANQSIDFNVALNTGQLDEAAKVANNMQATQGQNAIDDLAASSADATAAHQATLGASKDALTKDKNAAMATLKAKEAQERKSLERRERAEKKSLERTAAAQKKALDNELARKKRELDLEVKLITASTPGTKAAYDKQISQIEGAYKKYGVRLQSYGQDWSGFIGKDLTASIAESAASLQSDVHWAEIGKNIATQFVKGTFNLTLGQFAKWISTGKLPKGGLSVSTGTVNGPMANKVGHLPNFHSGGIVGDGYGGRTGIAKSHGKYPSEVTANLRRGEGVLNNNAMSTLGIDFVRNANKGDIPMQGGYDKSVGGATGLSGLGISMAAGMMKAAVSMGLLSVGVNKIREQNALGFTTAAKAGTYGGVNLSETQLNNAATIIGVGRQMGATQRDLIVAIMTSMQESSLKNLNSGDRDSLGLFQQRPSQGWGTPEQILDPKYASKKFFEHLLALKARNSMSLTAEAQAVQRSAFPNAYAKWEQLARGVVGGTGLAGMTLGSGWRKPVSPIQINRSWAAHPVPKGVDLGGTEGQPIYAANSGRVTTSADLHGTNIYDNDGYRSYGRYIVIDHGQYQTLYAHMNQRLAQKGANVQGGQVIGLLGSTGNSSGPHLHFETHKNGANFDPHGLIPGLSKGGFALNDGLAKIHQNEAVLTAPLTQDLKQGVQSMANGGGDVLIKIDLSNAIIGNEIDFEKVIKKGVKKALDERDSKAGRGRHIE